MDPFSECEINYFFSNVCNFRTGGKQVLKEIHFSIILIFLKFFPSVKERKKNQEKRLAPIATHSSSKGRMTVMLHHLLTRNRCMLCSVCSEMPLTRSSGAFQPEKNHPEEEN